MKFLRHLVAVVLTVAVIVGLGLLWAHFSGGGTGAGGHTGRAASRAALIRREHVKAGLAGIHPGDGGIRLADAGDLIKTCMVEAVLASVVITVSAARRRHRRQRRRAATA